MAHSPSRSVADCGVRSKRWTTSPQNPERVNDCRTPPKQTISRLGLISAQKDISSEPCSQPLSKYAVGVDRRLPDARVPIQCGLEQVVEGLEETELEAETRSEVRPRPAGRVIREVASPRVRSPSTTPRRRQEPAAESSRLAARRAPRPTDRARAGPLRQHRCRRRRGAR